VLAFDTGPGNMVLDALARQVTNGAQEFDRGGEMAARGQVNAALLEELLNHPYFAATPPKSTGREEFGAAYAARVFEAGQKRKLAPDDLLATAAALTAETISRAYRDFLLTRSAIQTVILGGGGVHNCALRDMLAERLRPARICTHADFGLPDDAKEAVAFALLGYATLRRRPSNVPSATGAKRPAILGKIAFPPDTGDELKFFA
jgi:anhydro-N-acetylmuramic acid kinase